MSADFTETPDTLIGPLNEVERKNAPPILYLRGSVELLRSGSRVSVVGTRSPTPEGLHRAAAVTEALVQRRIVVVSGLAAGIDTMAHTTAIQRGGRTVAVLGTELDRCYPKENRALQERIATEHLLVSQFAPGESPGKGSFPMRNRTMALLTDATVIVEAGEGSGTLHQGWEALRLGRLLFLMKSLVERNDLSWPKEMVSYGAQVLSRENLDVALSSIPERSRGEPAF